MFSLKELSGRVVFLRYKAGFTTFEIPEDLNVENQDYIYIEMGVYMPSEASLLAISKYHGVSPEWLLTGIPTNEYEAQLNVEYEIDKTECQKALRELGIE